MASAVGGRAYERAPEYATRQIRLPPCAAEPQPIPSSDAHFRLAVVCMTKRPMNFETWLQYHRDVVGVRRFYLRVEDTEWLDKLLSREPWDECVDVTYAQCTLRDWKDQTARQQEHVKLTIIKARAEGMTHLLHVDDDELLYCAQGGTALRDAALAAGPERNDLHALTIEALVPSSDCSNPFRDARVFRHNVKDFCSYGANAMGSTGKSIGVLAHEGLAMAGPHHFWSWSWNDYVATGAAALEKDDLETRDSATQLVLPPSIGVIVHYESCAYTKWLDKFTDYARRLRTEGSAPISEARRFNNFYQKSIHACAQRMDALASAKGGDAYGLDSLIGHYSASDAEEFCRDFWRSHKVEPPGLPEPRGVHRIDNLEDAGLTLMAPLAGGLPLLEAAKPDGDGAPARSVLEHPRSRRWRITHETHCWVREAPVLNSKRLDLRPPGDIVEVNAELDGEGGERWVRLAQAFANSTSGFMLIDGSSYGFGKLLEPLNDESPATLERKTPIAASPPPSTRSRPQAAPQQMSAPPHAPPSLIDVLVHAGIADGVASSYPAKLRDASDGAIGDLVSELTCSTEELGAACRRAKLPMGHRLGIVNALGKLRRAAGHIDVRC